MPSNLQKFEIKRRNYNRRRRVLRAKAKAARRQHARNMGWRQKNERK